MVKRFFCILWALLLLPLLALAETKPVVDDASLFTSSEIQQMTTIIRRIQETYQMDAVVVTSRQVEEDYWGDGDVSQAFADDYFDYNGYGLGSDEAGLLYLIDMTNRVPVISTKGVMIDYITDHRLEEMFDNSASYLRSGRYGQAAITVLTTLEGFLQEGREEGSFRYDAVTGERLSGLYNKLTKGEIALAVMVGLGCALVLVCTVCFRYSLKGSTYKYNPSQHCQIAWLDRKDRFLRQSVIHTRNESSGGGGHGGGGGGLGSSVHTSSSGSSHGGGVGGRF